MTRTMLSTLAIAALFTSAATPAVGQFLADDLLISSFQTGGSSVVAEKQRGKRPTAARQRVPSRAPGPGGLTGKQKALGAGMILPAVQGIVRAPTKKGPRNRKPDTSKDDCMACD